MTMTAMVPDMMTAGNCEPRCENDRVEMQSMCHARANICSNLVECCVMWAPSFQMSGSRSLSGTCSRTTSKAHEVAASRVLGV